MNPTADAYLIGTLTYLGRCRGRIVIAVNGEGLSWFLWSSDKPKNVNEARWRPHWEASPLSPDSSLVMQAPESVQWYCDQKRILAKTKAEENLQQKIDTIEATAQLEVRKATYAMWRLTALTRKDLLARGWSLRMIRNEIHESAIERKGQYAGMPPGSTCTILPWSPMQRMSFEMT